MSGLVLWECVVVVTTLVLLGGLVRVPHLVALDRFLEGLLLAYVFTQGREMEGADYAIQNLKTLLSVLRKSEISKLQIYLIYFVPHRVRVNDVLSLSD